MDLKKGDQAIEVTLGLSTLGVTISVKAHKAVEEFMKRLGNGKTFPVAQEAGPHQEWMAIGDQPLQVYQLERPIPAETYRLDIAGMPLLCDPYYGPGDGPFGGAMKRKQQLGGDLAVNLSFLRIPGISEGNGVRFHITTPYGADTLRSIREKVAAACDELYRQWMLPTDFVVQVVVGERSR